MPKSAMYLYGKKSVMERLKAGPKSVKKVFLQDNFSDKRITDFITSKNIPVSHISLRELLRIKNADRLQGIVAEAEKFAYTPMYELLAEGTARPSLIFLDGINDPHNLGSIMRIAACFGGFGLVIPRHNSCEVNETVIHVASGGENYTRVAMVTNLLAAVMQAKDAGYWIVGTVLEDGTDINKADLPFPICLIFGSEGGGIRQAVKKQLDMRVTLPMEGAKLSFNVAMACAIFCHEIAKRRGRT